jgi:hypothetical protein
MRLSLPQKMLLSVGVVAGIGVLAGAGTFATFTAQTTNPSNTFANGTLVLSNKVNAGAVCLSTGGGTTDSNSNGSCSTAFNLAVKAPGEPGRLGAEGLLGLVHRRRRRRRELPRHRFAVRDRPDLHPAVLRRLHHPVGLSLRRRNGCDLRLLQHRQDPVVLCGRPHQPGHRPVSRFPGRQRRCRHHLGADRCEVAVHRRQHLPGPVGVHGAQLAHHPVTPTS